MDGSTGAIECTFKQKVTCNHLRLDLHGVASYSRSTTDLILSLEVPHVEDPKRKFLALMKEEATHDKMTSITLIHTTRVDPFIPHQQSFIKRNVLWFGMFRFGCKV